MVIANVINPLLGKDFLARYDLVIDCTNSKLIDTTTSKTIKMDRINYTIKQIELIIFIFSVLSKTFYTDTLHWPL